MTTGSYGWKQRPSALWATVAVLVAIGVVVYGTIAISTGDPFWILQSTPATPDHLIVHVNGTDTTLVPGDEAFTDIANALRVSLQQIRGYPQGIGMSDQTLVDYRERDWSVEAFYAEPLLLRSRFRFGEPRQLIVPLSGRHADLNVVFLGNEDRFYTGPSLVSLAELRRRLSEHGLAAPME